MYFRKIVISSLVFLLFLTTITSRMYVSANTTSVSDYHDFQDNQYWSKPIEWVIEKGVIKGYLNAPHPKTKKIGNWLNPGGQLTEAQYLAILFRLFLPDVLANHEKSVKPGQLWDTGVYSLAKSFNIPNKNLHGESIRRGDTALILASGVTGKFMTEKEAVQWLYDNGLSTGVADASNNYPKTYDSFMPNEYLTRAQGITFVYRFVERGLPKTLTKVEKPTALEARIAAIQPIIDTFNTNNTFEISHTQFGEETSIYGDTPICYLYSPEPDGSSGFETYAANNPLLLTFSIDILTSLPDYPLDKFTSTTKIQEVMKVNKSIILYKNGYQIIFGTIGGDPSLIQVVWAKHIMNP